MNFYKKVNHALLLVLLSAFSLTNNAYAVSGNNDTTATLPLCKHLKKEGFAPVFSAGIGMATIVNYGVYGISGRAYFPLPLGLRIVADYTNFVFHYDWVREQHYSASLQYPLITHGRINVYASLGANLIKYKEGVGQSPAGEEYYDHFTFSNAAHYYLNPIFGLGAECRINKRFSIYNEWNMVNEDALKTTLGVRVNIHTLKRK